MNATVRTRTSPAVKAALLSSGFYSVFRTVIPSRRLAVLRYHAICRRDAGYAEPGICVSPAAFEQHVKYLAKHYDVLPLPEAVGALRRCATLPRNAVAITFDDGYADNLGAARTLARYGLPATFYITAGCLADGDPFWPSEVRFLVNAIDAPGVALNARGTALTLALSSRNDRATAITRLGRLFKSVTIDVREELREQLREAARTGFPSPMLTWDAVAAMHRMGMVIGSHTMTHPNLPSAVLEDAGREIAESKTTIEGHLGVPVTMFSYPNGGAERYMTPAVARLVKDAGFEAATTSRNGFASARSDLFALERVQVHEPLERLVFALEIERIAFKPKPRPGELE